MTASRSGASFRAVALLLLCVIAGVLIGVTGDRMVLLRQHRILPRSGMRMMTGHIVKRLDHELDLSAQQEKAITAVLENHRHRIEAVWSNLQPQVHNEIVQADHDIEAILTPPQKAKFQVIRERWMRQAHRFTR